MIRFSPAFLDFVAISGGVVEPQTVPQGHAASVLRWPDTTWTVSSFGLSHRLSSDANKQEIRDGDLDSIEKVIVMDRGTNVREKLALPAQGFLPDIFALAPGVARISSGAGMSLNWRENGTIHWIVADDGYTVDSLLTYRSQYLWHPLREVIASFLEEGPGIFTDEAPEAARPFRLPDRTHDWLSATWEHNWAERQCVYYDEQSWSIRVSVVNSGFRVEERTERSARFSQLLLWTPSLEVLQVYLAWLSHAAWAPPESPRRILQIPLGDTLAPSFSVIPVEPNHIDNVPVQLVHNGEVQAVMSPSRYGPTNPEKLSRLITMGLDALEISILNPTGAPALTTSP
jgi:hypothetical protein